MRIPILAASLLALTSPVLADEEFVTWPLGETQVVIWITDNGPGFTYFAPHDDENTSVAVAMDLVAAQGGTVIQLSHSGERTITFTLDGVTYVFDPNRMFTDTGAERSLKEQGKNFSPEALAAVRTFAGVVMEYVTEKLGEGKPLVALHNNSDGRYSIESYRPGGEYAKEASYVFQNREHDPDDFFFVTTVELYLPFRAARYNVALQNNKGMTDDGSLSVYAAGKGIPYVNVEAEDGHTAEQAAMLKFLAEVLK